MADLFILPELAAYMQVPSINEETGELLLELVTGLIEDAYGSAIPAPVPSRLRRVALEATKRAYLNPNGYESESLGDYSYRRASGSRGRSGLYLTADEVRQVAAAAGRATVRTVQFVGPYYEEPA
jgi:hypothetical protein